MTPLTTFLLRGGRGGNKIKDKNNSVLSVLGQYSVLSGKHERCVSHQLDPSNIFNGNFNIKFSKETKLSFLFRTLTFLDRFDIRTGQTDMWKKERDSWQECRAWSSAHLPSPCSLPLRLDWTGWQEVRYPHRRCVNLRSSAITHSLSSPLSKRLAPRDTDRTNRWL